MRAHPIHPSQTAGVLFGKLMMSNKRSVPARASLDSAKRSLAENDITYKCTIIGVWKQHYLILFLPLSGIDIQQQTAITSQIENGDQWNTSPIQIAVSFSLFTRIYGRVSIQTGLFVKPQRGTVI